jgi:hypothetical protein
MSFDERQCRQQRRTREGCWTCRRRYVLLRHNSQNQKPTSNRKKKCDAIGFPCTNCRRLGLACENQTALVWEDDVRRVGMKRRGPSAQKIGRSYSLENFGRSSLRGDHLRQEDDVLSYHPEPEKPAEFHDNRNRLEGWGLHDTTGDQTSLDRRLSPFPVIRYQQLSDYPHILSRAESLLLENYVQRFSRTYPTCSGPRNPFLSVLLPLAMRNDVVFNSLLALSGVQRWDHYDSYMETETLRLRQRALRGCRLLLEDTGSGMTSVVAKESKLGNKTLLSDAQYTNFGDLDQMDEEKALVLLTSSTLFLVYEKVSGEPNWKPHLAFMNRLLHQFFIRFMIDLVSDSATELASSETMEVLTFLYNIFLYNDLVRSTSLRTPTLSKFYLRAAEPGPKVMSQDAEFAQAHVHFDSGKARSSLSRYYFPNLIARISSGNEIVSDLDIMAWNGNLDWLPSFSLMDAENRNTSLLSAELLKHNSLSELLASQNVDGNHNDINSWDEATIITELYMTAARIYKRQIVDVHQHSNAESSTEMHTKETEQIESLASWAIQLVQRLPDGSSFETTLLWPIGIAAKELTWKHTILREYINSRLRSLEKRFQMRHFKRAQDVLTSHWRVLDGGVITETNRSMSISETILLG